MRRVAVTAVALLAGAAAAFAGDSALSMKGLGKARVRWNAVQFRPELMEQLKPGLTWRLGKDGPTRLSIEKMALVGADAVLLPGEMTLNLRFWEQRKWELVVYEENDWKWSEESTEFAVLPATVGTPTGTSDKKAGKSLEIELVNTTRGAMVPIERPAVTGDAALMDLFDVPDDVEYEPGLRKQWEALPAVDVRLRFGPNAGVVRFEAAKVKRLTGERADGEKIVLDFVQFAEPGVRTSFLEEHEGEIPIAVVHKGSPADGAPAVLALTGGDEPYLWVRSRNGKEEVADFAGVRHAVKRKKALDTVDASLEGDKLTIMVSGANYVFTLFEAPAITGGDGE